MFNEQNEIYRVLEDSELKKEFKYEEIIKKLEVKIENEKNKEKYKKYRKMLIKYINLIFLIKLLKTNYNFFCNFYQEDSKDGDKESPYELHRAVRYYLIDLFSILDYLEKFEEINIDKKRINEFKKKIRSLRNEIVHSSIPEIIYLPQNNSQNQITCIADTANDFIGHNNVLEIKIRIHNEEDEEKEIEMSDLLNLFKKIKNLIMDININEEIESL